jgi:hypothetical protein
MWEYCSSYNHMPCFVKNQQSYIFYVEWSYIYALMFLRQAYQCAIIPSQQDGN